MAAMLAGLALAAAPAEADPRPRVLIISLPTLTWEDVQRHELPNIERLLAESAVANLSLRTIGSTTSLEDAYATIGAGNRAQGALDAAAGYAADRTEVVAEGRAADVYAARLGADPGQANVLALGYPSLYRANRDLAYGARLGALAGSGVRTGVVANTDVVLQADEPGEVFRPAVAAMMDREGRVPHGTVGAALVEPAPGEPYGVRQSLGATTAAADAAWEQADVLLVEASDLARADSWREIASAQGWRRARSTALDRADRLVAQLVGLADSDDLVLVVSPTAGPVERLTVAAARGPGMASGAELRSPSTRRAGYVTLTDVAPTVLNHLGVESPVSMTGRPMSAPRATASLTKRASDLADADEAARFRDRWLTPFLLTFVILHALLSIAAIAALLRPRRDGVPRWLRPPTLVLLAIPVATFLLGVVPAAKWGAPLAFLTLTALSIGLAAAAEAGFSRVRLGPPMALATVTVIVLVIDVVTTERLQINTLFGYSPIVAGRFQGFGNQAFAVLAVCTIVAAGWVVALRGRTRPALIGIAIIFVVSLVASGAPPFGSDVGGILAATPAYGTAFILFSGRRIDRRTALLLFGGALVLLGVAAGIDLTRPAAERTHLGRVVQNLLVDPSSLLTTLRRKVLANLSVLRKSSFSLLVPLFVAFLVALGYRRASLMRELISTHPVLRPVLLATLVAAVLGFVLNDSGVAVPGVMLGVLNPLLVYSLTTLPHDQPSSVAAP